MDLSACLAACVPVLLLSLCFGLFYWEKHSLNALEREDAVDTVYIMMQLKQMFAYEENEHMAQRLANGDCKIYIHTDFSLAKTLEEEEMISGEVKKLDEYLSLLGVCGMFYKTGSVTPRQMLNLVGDRLIDIRNNERLYTYICKYPYLYQDVIYLLDRFA